MMLSHSGIERQPYTYAREFLYDKCPYFRYRRLANGAAKKCFLFALVWPMLDMVCVRYLDADIWAENAC